MNNERLVGWVGRRGGVARRRGLEAVGYLASFALVMAGCQSPSPVTSSTARGTQAAGLPKCPTDQTAKWTVRIYLARKLDRIVDPTSNSKKIRFDDPAGETNYPQDNDLDPASGAANVSSDQNTNTNVYHSDLRTIPKISVGDVVEYRIILDHAPSGNDFGENMSFWQTTDAAGLRIQGIGIDPNDKNVFICSRDVVSEGSTDKKKQVFVASVFMTAGAKAAATPSNIDSFNIAIVANNGSTDTPVLIDPKILNLG
jgi:hypothetical protein